MAGNSLPNGAPINLSPQSSSVVGINFGNSYASIAVVTKEGIAECIANEDGERQIACAIAFDGEEIYIGNQAKHQLIRNAQNTITGFRSLLGKKFSEIPQNKVPNSAPVIQHPDLPDVLAYKVQILLPAPTPLQPISGTNTPGASHLPTPRSEPIPAERVLSVSEVTTIFIKSLVRSAEDFLGQQVHGAVFGVPSWFDDAARGALTRAAEDAGVRVLQLLNDASAAATAATELHAPDLPPDRIQLVVDLGCSSLELALISIRDRLACALATSSDPTVGGDEIDDRLIKYFAREFTKKTKIPLAVCPAVDPGDKRAEAKLRLAVEHTKRKLSASSGGAACSVESLKEGVDFTGVINRLWFDIEVRPVYRAVVERARELVASAGMDLHDVDEVVYVGGSTSLPGLDGQLAGVLSEGVVSPFRAGLSVGDGPTTVLARGCALQGALLASPLGDGAGGGGVVREGKGERVEALARSVGLVFPASGEMVNVLSRDSILPARRRVRFDAEVEEGERRVGFEIWELREGVKVDLVPPPKDEDAGEEESGEFSGGEEEEELVEVKKRIVEKEVCLGGLVLEAKAATRRNGRWRTKVEVQVTAGRDGGLQVSLREVGRGDEETRRVDIPGPNRS